MVYSPRRGCLETSPLSVLWTCLAWQPVEVGWGISGEIKRGLLFSMKIARRLNTSALILFVDCLIYLVAQFAFTMLGWNPFVPILLTIGLIGLILSFALYFAARCVGEAEKIKAENEEYI